MHVTEMRMDKRLQTEKITPELVDYIVEKIAREVEPEKMIQCLTNSVLQNKLEINLALTSQSEPLCRSHVNPPYFYPICFCRHL